MGGGCVKHGYKGKGSTIHLLTDKNGSPLGVKLTSAKGDERKQVIPLFKGITHILNKKEIHIMGADKGYDSKQLHIELLKNNVYPLIPYRGGKNKIPIWIKRVRWKVERAISWLKRKYRRIATRWERLSEAFLGIVTLGICYFWVNKIVG